MRARGLTSRQVALLAGTAVLVMGGGFVAGSLSAPRRGLIVAAGAPAPDFGAVTLDVPPRPRHIGDFRGQTVLLNLWATWCGPCQVEMPSLEALHEKLAPRGLTVVAISVDDPGNEDKIRRFVADHGLTFQVLNEGSGRIEASYQSPGIPTTFLIDREGVIRDKVMGAADWMAPDRVARIEALLAER